MDESARRRFSRVLYEALNQQGYYASRIKNRSKTYSRQFKKIADKALNNDHIKCIFAGSFEEGISKLCSSDMDVMTVKSNIICVDERSHANEPYSLVFQNEYTHTFPGYVRLRADRPVRNHQRGLLSQRIINTGNHYLSSLLTLQAFNKFPSDVINGPACTSNSSIDAKQVFGFWVMYLILTWTLSLLFLVSR